MEFIWDLEIGFCNLEKNLTKPKVKKGGEMKVAFFSSEVFPFAKTGGLADVSGSLPLALAKAGCNVKVFMPFYKDIKPQKVHGDYGVTPLGKNIEIIFIKHDEYFFRDQLYGTLSGDYPDNLERFSFF